MRTSQRYPFGSSNAKSFGTSRSGASSSAQSGSHFPDLSDQDVLSHIRRMGGGDPGKKNTSGSIEHEAHQRGLWG